ncbi:hypothetical protein BLNAU_22985 [Blattamonas nauphoetae]|uniref:Uncharacterized protein n=1 Tax=Blattamonas nauphoetae TaxID=2049346 RepID=A0ABQ9WN47_9EUKA|nr:hypothetical protein BLNAU_24922 [Blattamonas nauphoetae]KAK2942113.1 hypothetical protein BLNAU_22985 [Blattamonas nauphoetae]
MATILRQFKPMPKEMSDVEKQQKRQREAHPVCVERERWFSRKEEREVIFAAARRVSTQNKTVKGGLCRDEWGSASLRDMSGRRHQWSRRRARRSPKIARE